MVDESAERIARATGKSIDEARGWLAKTNANGRLITAHEVARSILNLCHPDSGGVNGACVTIDGGTSA
jgi:NAD(P)-dependent dehydrogenase (short-subunit alcohol dehydrogenase family)